jgi:hypothetical protein
VCACAQDPDDTDLWPIAPQDVHVCHALFLGGETTPGFAKTVPNGFAWPLGPPIPMGVAAPAPSSGLTPPGAPSRANGMHADDGAHADTDKHQMLRAQWRLAASQSAPTLSRVAHRLTSGRSAPALLRGALRLDDLDVSKADGEEVVPAPRTS